MIKNYIAIQATILAAFHIPGIHYQIVKLLENSRSGELAALLEPSIVFSSMLSIYILQYLTVLIAMFVIFAITQAIFALHLHRYKIVNQHIPNPFIFSILYSLLSTFVLFSLNATYFDHSTFYHRQYDLWPNKHWNIVLMWLLVIIPVAYFLWNQRNNNKARAACGIILIALATFEMFNFNILPKNKERNIDNKPNIIMIGVDSLRSDLLTTHMPFLRDQLKKSFIFDNAYTELGRTFPSWNTILTGQYPASHGARINLIPESQLSDTEYYLPTILSKHGYKSIFAYDETRFADIGKHQGFDQVISPRKGASDFLLGAIGDQPLTNLLTLLPLSMYLMPEIYANRAIYHTYQPDSFLNLIDQKLDSSGEPTLFAVHFCLPHWPYKFATELKPELDYTQPYYPANLQSVDWQIKELFTLLEDKGYLSNSKIVFLSDHGESWPNESPAFSSDSDAHSTEVQYKQSYGHGSDLKVETANRALIAFKGFSATLKDNQDTFVSLADIYPTVLQEININPENQFIDGSPLQSPNLNTQRIIPVETGTIFEVKNESEEEVINLVNSLLNRYELLGDSTIRIKPTLINQAMNHKRYGLRSNHLILEKANKSYSLFNTDKNTFTTYRNLAELNTHKPRWAASWCRWYAEQSAECEQR